MSAPGPCAGPRTGRRGSRPGPGDRPAARPALWMLGGSVAFAAMGALAHALGPRCDWRVVALVRAAVMFASAVAMARAAGVRLVVFDPPTLWMRSVAGSLSLAGNFFALTHLPVADAITLANAHPIWIVLASSALMHRWPAAADVLGVASGLAGVALIQRPRLGGDGLAATVALLSSVATAVAMLGLHKLRSVDPRAIVAHFAGVATVVSASWLLAQPEALAGISWDGMTLLLMAGVGLTGTVGQVFLTRAYAAGPPAQVAVVGLSQVVFALGFDVVLWGRRLSPPTVLGFVLVVAPVAWLTGRAGAALGRMGQPSEGEMDGGRLTG